MSNIPIPRNHVHLDVDATRAALTDAERASFDALAAKFVVPERCGSCGMFTSKDRIRRNLDATVALNRATFRETAETYKDGTPVTVGRIRLTHPTPRVVTARGRTWREAFDRLREKVGQ